MRTATEHVMACAALGEKLIGLVQESGMLVKPRKRGGKRKVKRKKKKVLNERGEQFVKDRAKKKVKKTKPVEERPDRDEEDE